MQLFLKLINDLSQNVRFKAKPHNENQSLKTQIINTFEQSANETTVRSLGHQEDNSAVFNSKNVESEEPVGNNDSNLWCDLLSKKTKERFNFNENDIGEAKNKENNYDNSGGQIIWTRDESVNFNKYPIKENIKPTVTKNNYTPYNLHLEIAKAILLSKYIPNKAYVCDRNERRIIK